MCLVTRRVCLRVVLALCQVLRDKLAGREDIMHASHNPIALLSEICNRNKMINVVLGHDSAL